MLIAYLNAKDLRDRVHHAAAHVRIPIPFVHRRVDYIRWREEHGTDAMPYLRDFG
jgi:hypothetical protein